ncbi:MAG TPA: DUF1223 domain-containing protein [Ideonella sp.]|uniref:DUF1223 domain-containing protein n=1 Tax=Ideonella sp. TaxID=1929293 RepID=UPI002E30CD98|nr:DUF1223 domain-containing protein [Ideonella sp.]HEX5688042.1 DUF1223 domain-containing protein [Ideonella sp.]
MSASDVMLGTLGLLIVAAAPHGFAAASDQGSGATRLACRMAPPGARIVLAELYSSEGCDSCPPAERRFGAFNPGLELVPVVWHVDYFDSLGWVDRYALPASSQRQKALVAAGGVPAVVTPQVFVDGLAFPAWRDERALRSRLLRQAAQTPTVALVLQGLARDGDHLRFELRAQAAPAAPPIQLQAVLLEGGLVSPVSQGENRGVTLHHEHVVRAVAGPVAGAGPWRAQLALPKPTPAELAVVVWAQDETGRTLNASWARCTL